MPPRRFPNDLFDSLFWYAGRASQPDSSESQPEEEELGRAGAILKKSQPVAQHWSKTVESSIAKKKKKKRQKLSTGQ